MHVCTVVVCVREVVLASPCRFIDHGAVSMLTHLRARSSSLFPSYKPGNRTQAIEELADYVDLPNICVKPWSSMQVRYYLFYLFFFVLCWIRLLFSKE